MNRIAPLWKWLLVLLLAALAIVAAFHFDDAVRHWVTTASESRGETLDAPGQPIW